MNKEEQSKKMSRIITKAWADEGFKQRLLKDAAAVLKEEGVEIPQGLEVRVVENTDKFFYMVIPPKPQGAELSDAELSEAAGGGAPGKGMPCQWHS